MSDTVVVIESLAETVVVVQSGVVESAVPVAQVVEAEGDGTIYGPDGADAQVVETDNPEAISNMVPQSMVLETVTEGPQGPPGPQGEQGPQGLPGVLPIIADPNDGELHLTPKAASSGAEGTIFYCNDKHVYVGVEPL